MTATAINLHTDHARYRVIIYNANGVMVDITFEDLYDAMAYYHKATALGYHATLIEDTIGPAPSGAVS